MYSTVLFSALFDPSFETYIENAEGLVRILIPTGISMLFKQEVDGHYVRFMIIFTRLASSPKNYITIAGSGSLDLVRGLVNPERVAVYPSSNLSALYSAILEGKGVFPQNSNAARAPLLRLYPAVCKNECALCWSL